MSLGDRLAALFDLQAGERHPVAWMLAYCFCLGVAYTLAEPAAFALFMEEFGAQGLPWMYLATAAITGGLAYLYLKLGERLQFARLVQASLVFVMLLLLAARLGLVWAAPRWLVFFLPLTFQVLTGLGSLTYWSLAGRLFDLRQSKRLFGLIGSGQWIAGIIIGITVSVWVRWIGTANLFLAAALGLAGALGCANVVLRTYPERVEGGDTSPDEPFRAAGNSFWKERYALLIFALVTLSCTAYFVVENIFYDRAATQFVDADALASFLGLFFALSAVLNLLIGSLAASPLIARFGVQTGILALPVTLLAIGAALLGIGWIGGLATALFVLATLNHLANMSLSFTVDRLSVSILYQPLPPETRRRVQTIAEGIFQPVATGLAGIGLLVVTHVLAFNFQRLTIFLLAILVVWVGIAWVLGRREYPRALQKALKRRKLDVANSSVAEAASLTLLQQGLERPHAAAVIYSLNLLETTSPQALAAALPGLLGHAEAGVRLDVLRRIERLALVETMAAIVRRLPKEPLPEARGAALRALASFETPESLEVVRSYLEDADPEVCLGAVVGLVRHGGIEGILAAGETLLEMSVSVEPRQRALAAQSLGEIGVQGYFKPLVPLMRDGHPQVRRAALLAAGKLNNPRLWPFLFENLCSPPYKRAAMTALVAAGKAILPEIRQSFEAPGQPPATQVCLAQICGRMGTPAAIDLLKGWLAHPVDAVRSQVLSSLYQGGFQAREEDAERVRQQIRREARQSAWLLGLLIDVDGKEGPHTPADLLPAVLRYSLEQGRARLFWLLSFLYDRRAVLRARHSLLHGAPHQRAYALEVMDTLLEREVKILVLPLLEELAPEERLQRLGHTFTQPHGNRYQRLIEILLEREGHLSPWAKACALYTIAYQHLTGLTGPVLASLQSESPLVREVAACTLFALDSLEGNKHLEGLKEDIHPLVQRTARKLGSAQGIANMLSTVEKVLILKTVSSFAAMPDDALADVALLLEEKEVQAGEAILVKGEVGHSMYMIVEGQVRVHDGATTLNFLGAGQVFGELAVLDSEPRMASVSAVDDTLLLCLEQQALYELMEERVEVGQGIIRMLARNLRSRARELAALRSMPAGEVIAIPATGEQLS